MRIGIHPLGYSLLLSERDARAPHAHVHARGCQRNPLSRSPPQMGALCSCCNANLYESSEEERLLDDEKSSVARRKAADAALRRAGSALGELRGGWKAKKDRRQLAAASPVRQPHGQGMRWEAG